MTRIRIALLSGVLVVAALAAGAATAAPTAAKPNIVQTAVAAKQFVSGWRHRSVVRGQIVSSFPNCGFWISRMFRKGRETIYFRLETFRCGLTKHS